MNAVVVIVSCRLIPESEAAKWANRPNLIKRCKGKEISEQCLREEVKATNRGELPRDVIILRRVD